MQELRDRIAVVTGGASGIGRGMAEAFAAEGMKLVLADVEPSALEATVSELTAQGAAVVGVPCDVSKRDQVDAVRDRAFSEFGGVHVLCNNAGVGGSAAWHIWEAPEDEWDWVMGVNLKGVVYGLQSFVPAMIEQGDEGHIVSTSSMAGLVPGGGIYGVSKHAVVALSESLFSGLASAAPDIGVSVLCPGWVRTRIMESERNRPEAPRPELPADRAAASEMMLGMVANMVEKGVDPVEVGRLVVDSIRERRFYVLTHPNWKNMVEHRMQNILQDRPPLGVGPEGDGSDWFDLPES